MRFFSSRRTVRPAPRISTRVVKSRSWVRVNQLEIGMYVAELDRPWGETSFMFQGFPIESRKTLTALQKACEYVLVESEKVARVSSHSTFRLVGDHRTTH